MLERRPWDKRGLACKVTWMATRLLQPHTRVFRGAGALLALAGLAATAEAQVVRKSEQADLMLEELDLESFFQGFTTLNTDYNRATRGEHPRNVFEDLDLEFVFLEAPGGESVPGIQFDYERTFGTKARQDEPTAWTRFLALKSTGTLSFDGDVKPRDTMRTRLTWRVAYDAGGVSDAQQMLEAFTVGLNDFQDGRGGICVESPVGTPAANLELLDILVDLEDPAELAADPAWCQAVQQAAVLLDDQVHWDFGLDLGIENTQDWSQRQFRVGLASSLEYKTFDPTSQLRWLNAIDYPASVLRWLTGYDEEWSPSGTTFPYVGLDLSQVFVEDNRARRVAGDEDDFLRAHLEAAYRSPLGEIGGKLYHLDVGYHHYLDLDPSSSIEAADLDAYDYLNVEFSTDEGVFFAIDVGQLPLEARDTTVVSLGYRVAAR